MYDEEDSPASNSSTAVEPASASESRFRGGETEEREAALERSESAQPGGRYASDSTTTSDKDDAGWWPDLSAIGKGLEGLPGLPSPSSRDAELVTALLTVGWKMQVSRCNTG
jgi:hypothetical protein